MKKTIAVIAAALIMVGLASCLDRTGQDYNNDIYNTPQEANNNPYTDMNDDLYVNPNANDDIYVSPDTVPGTVNQLP